ncbi:MAG: hypothetical protein CL931_11020 [Deltaproteobacteria bacterium]|nr:hypothetical protein [Deltaproteobacteria bacterium]
MSAAETTTEGATISEELEQTASKGVAAQDEASLFLVGLRDVAIVSALLSLFAAAEAWAQGSGLAFAALLATVDGFLVGAATTALAHEWGHFAGARLGGGHAPLKPVGKFPQLFDFDYKNNDERAFLWMSVGGNLAHTAVPILYFVALPTNGPGTAALVAGAVGFAVFSSVIEWPVIGNARQGMGGLEALGTIPRDFVARTTPWAVAAAVLLFLAL